MLKMTGQTMAAATVAALLTSMSAFAASTMAESYEMGRIGFGSNAEGRDAMKSLLGQISEASKGAIAFDLKDGSHYDHAFGVVTGKSLTLEGTAMVNSSEERPAPGKSMTQAGISDSLSFSKIVASIESESGKADPAVKKCEEAAKEIGELSKKGSFKATASCEVTSNSRQTKVPGTPRKEQVETACAAKSVAAPQSAQAQAATQAPASAQAQAPAQQSEPTQAKIEKCYRTIEVATEKEISLISHNVTLNYSMTPVRKLSSPLPKPEPKEQSQAAQQPGSAQEQAPAQQMSASQQAAAQQSK